MGAKIFIFQIVRENFKVKYWEGFMTEHSKSHGNSRTGDKNLQQRDVPMQIPELTEMDMLSAKVTELENSVSQLKDQLLRKAAEFENYKKRTEGDFASIVKFANEDLISKLLPVLDDFERSMKAHTASKKGMSADESAFMRGMELIYTKLEKVLEQQGVKHFDAVGKPFDPQFHDALMQALRSDVPPHTVVEEVEKGYMLHDKVLRAARVIVAAEPAETIPQDDRETDKPHEDNETT
jgi:molecular chaperone GrpE